jgi:hypothetical protein
MMNMKPNLSNDQIAGLLGMGFNVETIHRAWRCNKDRVRKIRDSGVKFEPRVLWVPCSSCGLDTQPDFVLSKKTICVSCARLLIDA